MKMIRFGILMAFLIALASCTTDDNGTSYVGARLQDAVTIDGQISSSNEWSDTYSVD